MSQIFAKEREIAVRCVSAAARVCAHIRRQLLTPETLTKADRSPVTVADYTSQAIVCHMLREVFPNDRIVAEETASTLRLPENAWLWVRVTDFVRTVFPEATDQDVGGWIDQGVKEITPRYWCLDPIDGTKGFLRGDQYAIALALIEDGLPQLGVLACPNLPLALENGPDHGGTLFLAVKNQGAGQMPLGGHQPVPIRVATGQTGPGVRFCESIETTHVDHDAHQRVAARLGISTPSLRMDSQAKYGIVARGEAAIYLRLPASKTPDYLEKVWDHAAGAIIIEEAGGKVTDALGRALEFGRGFKMTGNRGVLATNLVLHEAVLACLQSELRTIPSPKKKRQG